MSINREEVRLLDRPVVVPDDDDVFRLAQLLLLLNSMDENNLAGASLERLSYYDFLVANPLLVLTDEDDADRLRLLVAGFDNRALMYASPSQRFTSRRERLQFDLARLVSYGLAVPAANKVISYSITESGAELAGRFTAMYSRAYSLSADILVRRLARMNDKRLRESAREWISLSMEFQENDAVAAVYGVDLLGLAPDTGEPDGPQRTQGPSDGEF